MHEQGVAALAKAWRDGALDSKKEPLLCEPVNSAVSKNAIFSANKKGTPIKRCLLFKISKIGRTEESIFLFFVSALHLKANDQAQVN